MIKVILFGFVLLCISCMNAQMGALSVEITGLYPVEGKLMLSLHNGPEGFPGNDETRYSGIIKPVTQDSMMVCFGEIPFGTYAVAIIHDVNGNGELDANFMGVPQEPVYFSNNARPGFGPPKYDAASFVLDKEKMTIHIKAAQEDTEE